MGSASGIQDFHPLSNVFDTSSQYTPRIDPLLQGDINAAGDVQKGSAGYDRLQHLGLTEDILPVTQMFGKAIAGGFAGSAFAGAGEGAGAGAGAGSGGGDGGGSLGFIDVGAEEASGGVGASTEFPNGASFPAGATDPTADPNTNQNAGPAMVSDTGMTNLSPEVAQLLGIDTSTGGGFGAQIPGEFGGVDTATGMVPGGSPTFGDGFDQYGYSGEVDPSTAAGTNPDGGSTSYLDQANAMLKKLGLSPASAAMLGISGVQALSKPKIPQAAKTLGDQAGPAAATANQTIQSGGTSSPAWQSQKASIDATIDQQVKEQTAAMLQRAQNSGQGADSQVTQQQINKIKTQLETQRQAMYAQAQAQNVQAALSQLGISDQALSQVANAQFQASNAGKQSAAQTAQIALMLQQLANRSGGSTASVVNQGNTGTASLVNQGNQVSA